MFKFFLTISFGLALINIGISPANAWEQHTLPTSFTQSSTTHYGGNKAPLVLSPSQIKTVSANQNGMHVWNSSNDGINWTSKPLTTNNSASITQAYLATDTLALGWSDETPPVMFRYSASSDSWSAASHVWPLASWKIIHVGTSTTGDPIVLATEPKAGNLVEGELFIIYGNQSGWSTPVMLSSANASVGDASLVTHVSGLQSVVWSQRNALSWEIMVRNSSDGQTWTSPTPVVQNIAAPYFLESGVQIAADTLNHEEIALAFTGWENEVYSQVWSKAFDAITGNTTQAKALLPSATDMAVQPSVVTLANNTWAVAWQQNLGIDSEIYVVQHESNGTWTNAVNVSVDPMHLDRDPHITLGSSKTLTIAYTRRVQADTHEVYTFAEGDINDSSLDSDGDGIADSQEQGQDLDQDGIDDAQSARVATWVGTEGRYALIVEGNGELRQVQAPAFAETHYDNPQSYQVSGSLFSFQIHALSFGESTQVHLKTPQVLDIDTTWLKLNPDAQWSDSERNNVYRDALETGLIINLTDGGAGDEDGVSNGIIVDPAVLATPNHLDTTTASEAVSAATNESQAGGCLVPTQNKINQMLILLMGFILLVGSSLLARQSVKLN
ncbi:MAG: choice-of-anchor U domain-containing protein [Ghiorsea sp.]